MKHVEVVAAVIVQGRKVFAAQRGAKGEVAHKWEFPGGKIEAGESHGSALARELLEELAIRVEVGKFLVTVEHQYQSFALTMHCYQCDIVSGSIQLVEHVDSRWLAHDELESVDWAAADRPVLDMVKTLVRP